MAKAQWQESFHRRLLWHHRDSSHEDFERATASHPIFPPAPLAGISDLFLLLKTSRSRLGFPQHEAVMYDRVRNTEEHDSMKGGK
jgi:hypothetical protein